MRRRILSLFSLLLFTEKAKAYPKEERRSYKNSCLYLENLGFIDKGKIPQPPDKMPRYDDPEPLGVNFFRLEVHNQNFENLTLKRTFFGRSEIAKCSFANSDLSESNLCWNDFINVKFDRALLTRADLRSSIFSKVSFLGTDLSEADLRRSTYENCNFQNANLTKAVATLSQAKSLKLTKQQQEQVNWTSDEGEEPDGG